MYFYDFKHTNNTCFNTRKKIFFNINKQKTWEILTKIDITKIEQSLLLVFFKTLRKGDKIN